MFEIFSKLIHFAPLLLSGARISIYVTGCALFLGLPLGLFLGITHTGSNKFLRYPVGFYVWLIRGTPMLVQIACVYFVLPTFGVSLSAFWTASLAIGLNSAAYISQIIRAGINSVNKGQREAGYVLGLSHMQVIRFIVLPQAIKTVLPALGNEATTLIKDSSLASVIGVLELYKQAQGIINQTYDVLTVFFGVAIIYLVMTTVVSGFFYYVEKRGMYV